MPSVHECHLCVGLSCVDVRPPNGRIIVDQKGKVIKTPVVVEDCTCRRATLELPPIDDLPKIPVQEGI